MDTATRILKLKVVADKVWKHRTLYYIRSASTKRMIQNIGLENRLRTEAHVLEKLANRGLGS